MTHTTHSPEHAAGVAAAGIVVIIALLAAGIIAASLMANRGGTPLPNFDPQQGVRKSIGLGEADLRTPYDILEVTLQYTNPTVTINTITKKSGFAPKVYPYEGSYKLQLLGDNDAVLKDVPFVIPNNYEDDLRVLNGTVSSGKQVTLHQVSFALTVPYKITVKRLRVLSPSGTELSARSVAGIKPSHSQDLLAGIRNILSPDVSAQSNREYLDIVVMGNGVNADIVRSQSQAIKDALLTYEPFSQKASAIRFKTIENTDNLECRRIQGSATGIWCEREKVTKRVNDAKVPYDSIIVLVGNQEYGGAAALGGNIVYLYSGPDTPTLAVHEFGHSFGALQDEYTDNRDEPFTNKTLANCHAGQPPAQAWNGVVQTNDYTQGCLHNNWYRSSQTSIMKTVNSKFFNAISIKLLNEKLQFFSTPDSPLPDATTPPPPQGTTQPQQSPGSPSGTTNPNTNPTACSISSIAGTTTSTSLSITGIIYISSGSTFDYSNRYKSCATIRLKQNGSVILAVQSDPSDGTYGFAGLSAGNYEVEASIPSGYTTTASNPRQLPNMQSTSTLINFGLTAN